DHAAAGDDDVEDHLHAVFGKDGADIVLDQVLGHRHEAGGAVIDYNVAGGGQELGDDPVDFCDREFIRIVEQRDRTSRNRGDGGEGRVNRIGVVADYRPVRLLIELREQRGDIGFADPSLALQDDMNAAGIICHALGWLP